MNPLDEVVELLNAESLRLFGVPLEEGQAEAVYIDEDECLGMMDDMEARMGFNVTDARRIAAAFYSGEG